MRNAIAAQLLAACEQVYAGNLTKNADLPSRDNTVGTYMSAANQQKYVHMYFAKQVGCWRAIKSRLSFLRTDQVVSVGAGPLLCVLGWFWDDPRRGFGTTVIGYDLLDWHGVVPTPEHTALRTDVFAGQLILTSQKYIPDGVQPPQSVTVIGAKSLTVAELRRPSVVLLPSVLNHLVGGTGALNVAGQKALFSWLENARRAGHYIVIADMLFRSDTAAFWNRITTGLGAPAGHDSLNLVHVVESNDVAQAYTTPGQARRRAGFNTNPNTPTANQKAGVLAGGATGWAWVT